MKAALRDSEEIETSIEGKYQGKWLAFSEMTYIDPTGVSRKWEYVERIHRGVRSPDTVDAVEIIAIVKHLPDSDKILLVRQYRPPIKQYCLEFPAGLIENNESIEQAASRELMEETGYTITTVSSIAPCLFYEPGLASSNMRLVHAIVENRGHSQKLEHDEWSLKTVLLSMTGLYTELLRIQSDSNTAIDAKLFTFAYGLTLKS